MDKLKILFLTNRLPFPIKDGQTRRTFNILKGLAEEHDVYLLSLYEQTNDICDSLRHLEIFCKKVEIYPAPPKKLCFSMLSRLFRSLISRDPYTIWRHYSTPYLKRIRELTQEVEFDIVHCDILPIAYTVRDLRNIPCTLTDHDVCYLKDYRMARHNPNLVAKLFLYFESFKLKRFESNIFQRVDLGITVSEIDKKILKALCPDAKLEVIENGVDTDTFNPGSEKIDDNTLLWVGGFGYYPNSEAVFYFLEKIYPLVKKECPDVQLKIVGGSVPDRLKKYAAIDTSVKLLGFVDDPLPYIQGATVFIVPILSGSGTRLKTLEAMSAGKAIVTTTVGCEGIEGVDGEHYLIADEPEEFAKKIILATNDKALRQSLGENARSLARQKYDWRIIYGKMNSIYRTMRKNGLP